MAASLPPTVGSKGYLSLANGLALLARGALFFCRTPPSGSRLGRPPRYGNTTLYHWRAVGTPPRLPAFVAISMQVQEGELTGPSRASTGRA